MITNRDVLDVWSDLSYQEKLRVVNKFELAGKDPRDFLKQTDIKKYISRHYILTKEVITK